MSTSTPLRKQRLDTTVIFRASDETKVKAQAVRELMQLSSTSAVIRQLIDEKYAELRSV